MKRSLYIGLSILLAIGLIAGAWYVRHQSTQPEVSNADKITPPPTEAATNTKQHLTIKQLAAFDGKDDHDCYVAVSGKVYKIEQGLLWNNGQHETADGQAMCGLDLTAAMAKSPHGTSKLDNLEVIGKLKAE